MIDRPLLVTALLDPAGCAGLSAQQWDLLVRQARRANLLARLATRLDLAAVPVQARQHLESALILAERQAGSVRHEARCLADALSECGTPVILLKGAAYLLAGHAPAAGRMFSDIDILVRHARLAHVEKALLVRGWEFDPVDAYDDRYYRQWMHELPPLRHRRRGSALDVHHTLLPPTARTRLDTDALFEAPVPLPGLPGLFVLPPEDMVLHSAAHLFHEGELPNGLRDLFDLDALLREFSAAAGFWPRLLARAERIGLGRALFHALRYGERLLGTPVPADVRAAAARWAPHLLAQQALDACYARALQPLHRSCDGAGTGPALFALYVRSHWLRMPWLLLTYHLGRKLLMRQRPAADDPQAGRAA